MCVGKFCLGCSQRETSLTDFCIRGENWASYFSQKQQPWLGHKLRFLWKDSAGFRRRACVSVRSLSPTPRLRTAGLPAYCCLCSQHNRNLLDIFGVKTLNTQTGGFLERLSLGQDRQSSVTSLLGGLTSTPELHTCSYGGKANLVSLQHPPRQALGSLLLPCPFPSFC